MFVRTIQYFRSITEDILHYNDRDRIDSYAYTNERQGSQSKSASSKPDDIIDNASKNPESKSQPIDDRGRRQTQTARLCVLRSLKRQA